MAYREVTHIHFADDGDVAGLCGEWGLPFELLHVSKRVAIAQILNNVHIYFVSVLGHDVLVKVIPLEGGYYLRTDPDVTLSNNLLKLPPCSPD